MATSHIRYLKSGEKIPDAPPRRYPRKDNGYVELRWKVGVGEYIGAYEHRVGPNGVIVKGDVHHLDEDPSNNNPSNLLIVANNSEHRKLHVRIDETEVIRLYQNGLSIPEISDSVGFSASAIYLALLRNDITIRPQGWKNLLDLPDDEICELYDSGMGCKSIGKLYGVSEPPISRVVKASGRTLRKRGTNQYTSHEG